jgi:hypothetical protein
MYILLKSCDIIITHASSERLRERVCVFVVRKEFLAGIPCSVTLRGFTSFDMWSEAISSVLVGDFQCCFPLQGLMTGATPNTPLTPHCASE